MINQTNHNILKGNIYITDNTNVVYNFPLDAMNKIINLDEDDVLPENNNVIGGTCLLPPINAKIAEADGDENNYDSFYIEHLTLPYQQQFIGALITFLYKGGNLLLFLPELGYTNTRDKLLGFMFSLYGLHIGIINDPIPQNAMCYYDLSATPIWLNLIYLTGTMSAQEYLSLYPEDADLTANPKIMELLINNIRPYSNTLSGKINYILQYHKLIHKNKNVINPIKILE